jgi:outer membrane protein assembly factor BamE (lipoprotein component of BamABCDE complex)
MWFCAVQSPANLIHSMFTRLLARFLAPFLAPSLAPLLALLALLGACDREGRPVQEIGLDRLAVGVSSEGDVRTAMGRPETTWEDEDGTRILEYPKAPEGSRTWIFTIDPRGKLIEYHQALTTENFARIVAGMSRDAVRRLLGKPRSVVRFALSKEEVWDYRFLDQHQSRLFNVHFDEATGKVLRTSSSEVAY